MFIKLVFKIKTSMEQFSTFYVKKYTGRKLEWLLQYCKGDLQTLYTKKKYIFQV